MRWRCSCRPARQSPANDRPSGQRSHSGQPLPKLRRHSLEPVEGRPQLRLLGRIPGRDGSSELIYRGCLILEGGRQRGEVRWIGGHPLMRMHRHSTGVPLTVAAWGECLLDLALDPDEQRGELFGLRVAKGLAHPTGECQLRVSYSMPESDTNPVIAPGPM
jgi:hypothetical protein